MSYIVGGAVVDNPKLPKIYALFEQAPSPQERNAAKLAAIRLGYYIDRVGVMWEVGHVPDWVMTGEPKQELDA